MLPALFVLALAAFGVLIFLCSDAARLATVLRWSGPASLTGIGVVASVVGFAPAAAVAVMLAVVWARRLRRRGVDALDLPQGRTSIRAAALEMEVDRATKAIGGFVLAGSFEGRALASLDLDQLVALWRELSIDRESRELLEAYLDRRFPTWRIGAKANHRLRHGASPTAGAMSKEEAYQILGLEAGAAATDIREAHRRLLQGLDTGIGRASFLAARINEAKHVLLSDHD